MNPFAVLALAAQLAPGAPSAAQDAQIGFDIRCMLVSQSASEKVTGPKALALQIASMYYFGRVDSVLSGVALEAQLEAEAKALEGKPLDQFTQQCGRFMQSRGSAIQAIGARLLAREEASKIQ